MWTRARAALCLAGLTISAVPAALPTPALAQTMAAKIEAADPKAAEATGLAVDIHEEIVKVRVTLRLANGKPFTGDMVITHFRPPGPGPFPVAVHSHGRSSASRHEPARMRPTGLARYWIRRGFAVVVPTRVGYGELGQAVDPEAAGACESANYRPALAAMAAQIDAAVAFAGTLPWVDRSNVVLSGASYGGFGTIAAAGEDMPGVVGAINFVGGLGGAPLERPGEPCQGPGIEALAGETGARSRVPMLWLYSENDRFWGADWPRRWHKAFTAAGGKAQFAMLPPVGDDGHKLTSEGHALWRPVADRFLVGLGFALPTAGSTLPATQFARLDEADRVPNIRAGMREGYAKFLAADIPRAFAISPAGAWAWRVGRDAAEVAVNSCQFNSRSACSLYAVDDRVVWKDSGR